jgi:phosphopantetheinyl transferase
LALRRESVRPSRAVAYDKECPATFNLSHTSGLVASAGSLERDTGLKVEDPTSRVETIELAKIFLCQ